MTTNSSIPCKPSTYYKNLYASKIATCPEKHYYIVGVETDTNNPCCTCYADAMFGTRIKIRHICNNQMPKKQRYRGPFKTLMSFDQFKKECIQSSNYYSKGLESIKNQTYGKLYEYEIDAELARLENYKQEKEERKQRTYKIEEKLNRSYKHALLDESYTISQDGDIFQDMKINIPQYGDFFGGMTINLIIELPVPKYNYQFLRQSMSPLKKELIAYLYHPDRVSKFLETNDNIDDYLQ